jgi:cytochrome c553
MPGMSGVGDASGAFPRLTGQAAWYLYKQLKDYASGARENAVMSPIARSLSDVQMQSVAAYYADQTAPRHVTREPDPMELQIGGAISAAGHAGKRVAACVSCHGPAGRGLPPSFPYLAGQYAPYAELQMQLWKQGKRKNDPFGVMQHIAEQLSEAEIRALATYFESVPNGENKARLTDGAK